MYRSICIVLVLFTVSEAIFTGHGPDDGQFSFNACRKANNVTDELIKNLFSSKLNPEMDNPQGQCFVACLGRGIGILKSDGTVDGVLLVNTLEKVAGKQVKNADAVIEVLTKCADQPGEGCEKKYKIVGCVYRAQALVRFR